MVSKEKNNNRAQKKKKKTRDNFSQCVVSEKDSRMKAGRQTDT